MNPSIMARRAAANPTIQNLPNPSTLLLPVPAKPLRTVARRNRAVKLTATQRDSTGRMSHWSRAATYFDAVEVDRRWSRTIRDAS